MHLILSRVKYFFAIAQALPKNILMEQNIHATRNHCKYCFDVLLAKLNNKPLPDYPKEEIDC